MTPARVNGATTITAICMGLAGLVLLSPDTGIHGIGVGMCLASLILLLTNLAIAILICKPIPPY